MGGHGSLHLFDYRNRVEELAGDLKKLGFSNIHTHGNSRARYDSYAWSLGKLLQETPDPEGYFHLAFLDGAHTFFHDAPANLLLMRLVRCGGYLLMDDYEWTLGASPTMNPKVSPEIAKQFTQEQIDTPHVRMICELFLERDSGFVREAFGDITENRRLYRRL